MANLITPLYASPINVPIECATTSTSAYQDVEIGTSIVPQKYFYGRYYKKPSATNLGIDISSHLNSLPQPDLTPVFKDVPIETIDSFFVPYRIKMFYGATENYSFDGKVFYQNLKIEDWFRFKEGIPFGRYEDYLDTNIPTQVLNNGEMYIGQTTAPNWTSTTIPFAITVSQFPLEQNYYSIYYSGVPQAIAEYFKYNLTATDTYRLTFDVRKDAVNNDSALQVLGVSSSVTTSWQTKTFEFLGAESTNAIPVLRFIFETTTSTFYIRNIKLENITFTDWRLPNQLDDWMLHNRLYTYDSSTTPYADRHWNKTLKGAPLSVYFYNPTAVNYSLSCYREYYTDKFDTGKVSENTGVTASDIYVAFRMESYSPYYDYYGFRIEFEDKPIRMIFFESIDPSCFKTDVYQLYYINRRGAVEYIIMSKKSVRTLTKTTNFYKSNWRTYNGSTEFIGGLDKQLTNNYNISSEETYFLNSEIETKNEYKYLEELITSPKVWMFDAQTKDLFAVELIDNNFEYKNFQNNEIFNFDCTVKKQLTNNRR